MQFYMASNVNIFGIPNQDSFILNLILIMKNFFLKQLVRLKFKKFSVMYHIMQIYDSFALHFAINFLKDSRTTSGTMWHHFDK